VGTAPVPCAPVTGLPAVVLCGGRGTRAYPLTADVPKPLLPAGEHPVLRHVLEVFARQGHTRFVLAAGFRADAVADYARTLPEHWDVTVLDTGEETGTGERIRRCCDLLGDRFFATYGDGVGNVDLAALLARHEAAGGRATVTAVPLRSQYGTLDLDGDDRVVAFREKPVLDGHWVNGGFLVLERTVLTDCPGDDLERDVLPSLSRSGELYVYRHAGSWMSVDTHKDLLEMQRLAREGDAAPWFSLPVPASSSPERPGSSART
jgi:glucose-1-phosphate cytidylyltransferase